jgi:hypothetical protein
MNDNNSLEMDKALDKSAFYEGLRDGIPIGLGYFAVAFSLGIAYRNAGITAFQGFLTSITNATSAGQFAAVSIIVGNASYFEMALTTLIINARYFLMSAALSQKLSPKMPFFHRFLFCAAAGSARCGRSVCRCLLCSCALCGLFLYRRAASGLFLSCCAVCGPFLSRRAVFGSLLYRRAVSAADGCL